MNRVIYTILLLFLTKIAISQTVISGKVKSKTDEIISNVSVTVSEIEDDNILTYTTTNNQGNYSLKFSTNSSRVQMNVRRMGYQFERKIIEVKSQTIDFELIAKDIELKEVIVRVPPIRQLGDTITYNVQSFSGKSDRSIADVLSKMPGIEILPDGKVLYQGKPINKYYIEGLDLLEGKYNLANKNLPFGQVTNVQIFENHQPIRVLDSLVFSENAALNIQLKNKISFTGLLKAGMGHSPLLYEGNFTPMIFSPKQQMISSYQANNSGENISSQLKTLTIEDLIDNYENNGKPRDWLEIQQLKSPNIPEKRWLDNQSHLLTANYLYKLDKDYEIRLNASYLNESQKQLGCTKTIFFTPNEDILIEEEKQNTLYFKSLQTNLTFLKNTRRSYLKNSFETRSFWDSQAGNIMSNQLPIIQSLSNQYFEGSNKLKVIFPLGKQLITLNSLIGISRTPQNLVLQAKQVEDLFEGTIMNQQIRQELLLKCINMDSYVSLTKSFGYFTIIPKIGVLFENQFLKSNIASQDVIAQYQGYDNQLDWERIKSYFELQTQFSKQRTKIELRLPLNYNVFHIGDTNLQKGQHLAKIFSEPKLSITYDLNAMYRINSSVGLSNQFGTINSLYYAYIIKNYRNIQRIDSPLPVTNNQNYSLGISFKNPIKSIFASLNFAYILSKNNLIYQNDILKNGVNNIQVIERENIRKSYVLTGRVSKSLNSIKSNISLATTISFNKLPQIINTNEVQIASINESYNLELTSDFSKFIGVQYYIDLMISNNKIQENVNEKILNCVQKLNINSSIKNHQLAIECGYFQNKFSSQNTNNFFSDLAYRYTLTKHKVDFEIRYNNIFNTNNFVKTTVDNFSYVENNYKLRPSQILVKIIFAL